MLDAYRDTMRMGLIAGLVALSVSVIGMVVAFDERDLITGTFTLGQLILFGAPLIGGYLVARDKGEEVLGVAVPAGLISGLVSALPIFALLILTLLVPNIRNQLLNVSEDLITILTFGQSVTLVGGLIMAVVMTILGGVGAAIYAIPDHIERPVLNGVSLTLLVGLFSEIFLNVLRPVLGRQLTGALFGTKGVTPIMAIILLVGALTFTAVLRPRWTARGGMSTFLASDSARKQLQTIGYVGLGVFVVVWIINNFVGLPDVIVAWVNLLTLVGALILAALWRQLPSNGKSQADSGSSNRGFAASVSVALLILPLVLGTYLSEVVDNVGLYILMGLGLNIVVGFAGLLDLGYVAFFAIGAYTMGILTSTGGLGLENPLSFWIALPICIVVSITAGVILGFPVLRMRGDYLAIVTLGFGEIIRVLATSDLLKPLIGGAQGILQIPNPQIRLGGLVDIELSQPQDFYYLLLIGCAIAAFVSYRLRDARLGRQWMALREDEDVAEAMGINLVSTKLLAFAIGAGFSGLAGSIFAAKLGSIFPHSFNLLISINVLSLIIVGGMGSLPGVVVGAIVLVGLPELLREFTEFRLLLYGVLLIAMMLSRPDGLWPSPIRQRELKADEDLQPEASPS